MSNIVASPAGEDAARPHAALNASHRIVRRREVEDITGLSRSSLYRLAAAGQFPRPIQLSARAVGWRASDVAAWLESRVAGGRK
jgi:prophage regulatory protein